MLARKLAAILLAASRKLAHLSVRMSFVSSEDLHSETVQCPASLDHLRFPSEAITLDHLRLPSEAITYSTA